MGVFLYLSSFFIITDYDVCFVVRDGTDDFHFLIPYLTLTFVSSNFCTRLHKCSLRNLTPLYYYYYHYYYYYYYYYYHYYYYHHHHHYHHHYYYHHHQIKNKPILLELSVASSEERKWLCEI
jgi:hypothetical protein